MILPSSILLNGTSRAAGIPLTLSEQRIRSHVSVEIEKNVYYEFKYSINVLKVNGIVGEFTPRKPGTDTLNLVLLSLLSSGPKIYGPILRRFR